MLSVELEVLSLPVITPPVSDAEPVAEARRFKQLTLEVTFERLPKSAFRAPKIRRPGSRYYHGGLPVVPGERRWMTTAPLQRCGQHGAAKVMPSGVAEGCRAACCAVLTLCGKRVASQTGASSKHAADNGGESTASLPWEGKHATPEQLAPYQPPEPPQ